MNKYDLSVLIPARNEMFVAETVKNLLANIRGKTEIIVALDGAWAYPQIPDAPNVTIIHFPTSIGQRAATNQAARLSKAKYVMKLDGHCAVDEGFDVKLMANMQDDWTVIPALYNLHGFDWVCIGSNKRSGEPYETLEWFRSKAGCGHTIYQGPTPEKCEKCSGNMERQLVFKPRLSKRSEFYRFDNTLHFKYHGSRKHEANAQGDIAESMSAQGSCFMLTREKYWELNISDENHGSWGQQGTEVACATWLSGGKLMVNKTTWYSHMFRTQGGDFGFPYPLSGSDQEKARTYSKDIWFNNKHPKQIRPLSWLLERFWPLPEWSEEDLVNAKKMGEEFYAGRQAARAIAEPVSIEMAKAAHVGANPATGQSKGIIFYTDNKVNLKIAHKVQNQLKSIGLPIVSASLKPMPHMGRNIHLRLERGYLTMFKQILAALEASTADIIFFCEHDVIYHPSHFEFTPSQKDKFYYNLNYWKFWPDGFIAHWDANQVSGLSVYREYAINYYRNRIKEVEQNGFNRSYEPGGRDKTQYENWRSEYPNIDIRSDWNLTKSHRKPEDFRDKSTCINWEEVTIDKISGWDINFLKQIFLHIILP